MNTITDLIKAFMILVNAGGIFRIITLIFSTINDPDLKETNFRRGRNVILFMILTILIYSLKKVRLKIYKLSIFDRIIYLLSYFTREK